jgi:hypothetical protein
MKSEAASPRISLGIIWAMSLLVPSSARRDWRREWEAEVINRWLLREKWKQSTLRMQSDLLKRIAGALFDVLWFQETRARLLLVMLNMLVAALTGFGALQELLAGGLFDRKAGTLLLSLTAVFVSLLFIISGVAMLRHWRTVRRLMMATGCLSILLHVYGALPPHRNIGYLALLVGAGYGLVMLLGFEWQRRRDLFV